MNFKENIRIAIFSIRTNLMRSLLTMLGIIIGVSSVIAIITLGNAGRDYIVGMIRDMGSSTVSISVNSTNASATEYITQEDIKAIKDLDTVDCVSPFILSIGNATTTHTNGIAIGASGTRDFETVMSVKIKYGRFYTQEEYESGSHVALITAISAISMFGYENCVNQYIDFSCNEHTARLKIIGVIEADSMLDSSSSTEMYDDMLGNGSSAAMCVLVLPSTVTDIMMGSKGYYEMLYLTAISDDKLDAAGNAALNTLY
ncbi:MAG: ABC transporter permease, partial [Clostridiales bacterium]|nr:ABC transporter permease [Clostridiales bacterium]